MRFLEQRMKKPVFRDSSAESPLVKFEEQAISGCRRSVVQKWLCLSSLIIIDNCKRNNSVPNVRGLHRWQDNKLYKNKMIFWVSTIKSTLLTIQRGINKF